MGTPVYGNPIFRQTRLLQKFAFFANWGDGLPGWDIHDKGIPTVGGWSYPRIHGLTMVHMLLLEVVPADKRKKTYGSHSAASASMIFNANQQLCHKPLSDCPMIPCKPSTTPSLALFTTPSKWKQAWFVNVYLLGVLHSSAGGYIMDTCRLCPNYFSAIVDDERSTMKEVDPWVSPRPFQMISIDFMGYRLPENAS